MVTYIKYLAIISSLLMIIACSNIAKEKRAKIIKINLDLIGRGAY